MGSHRPGAPGGGVNCGLGGTVCTLTFSQLLAGETAKNYPTVDSGLASKLACLGRSIDTVELLKKQRGTVYLLWSRRSLHPLNSVRTAPPV